MIEMTLNLKFEPQRSEAEHATSRSQRLSTIKKKVHIVGQGATSTDKRLTPVCVEGILAADVVHLIGSYIHVIVTS